MCNFSSSMFLAGKYLKGITFTKCAGVNAIVSAGHLESIRHWGRVFITASNCARTVINFSKDKTYSPFTRNNCALILFILVCQISPQCLTAGVFSNKVMRWTANIWENSVLKCFEYKKVCMRLALIWLVPLSAYIRLTGPGPGLMVRKA